VILGGGVAVCLLLSAHRTVIFTIAKLSCVCLLVYQIKYYVISRGLDSTFCVTAF